MGKEVHDEPVKDRVVVEPIASKPYPPTTPTWSGRLIPCRTSELIPHPSAIFNGEPWHIAKASSATACS